MTRIHVAIAVVGDARNRLYEVATICRRLGFGHTSTNTDVGVLKGLAALEDLPALRAVPGVLAIEMEESRGSRGSRRSMPVRIRTPGARRLRRAAGRTGQ
jgi:hypothetical protein